MKKLVIALTAIAAFTGSALAADLPARPYAKAPAVMAPVYSWTGCWISGGGGGGINKIDHDNFDPTGPFWRQQNASTGMTGWLVTAGGGCDYQFNNRWVIGGFVDGTWSDITGDHAVRIGGVGDMGIGQNLKNDWSWSFGGRAGYLVAPNVLTYLNAGFTQTHLNGVNVFDTAANGGLFTGIVLPGQTFNGVFIGSGVEYSFDWMPGLFLKSEGRAAWFNRQSSRAVCATAGTVCNGPGDPAFVTDDNLTSRRPVTYIAKTELVYRFNWGGPAVTARY